MGAKKSGKELENHINSALNKIGDYLNSLLDKNPKKSELIAYWLHDFTRMVDFEERFNPKRYKRYKKGDIIKVNLGFNVGSEQGGLHYAVVLEKNNAPSSSVITIAPLTSKDASIDTKKGTRYGEIDLGDELFNMLINKCSSEVEKYYNTAKECERININNTIKPSDKSEKHRLEIEKALAEIKKMKHGSVCLISQITTISKIRIYDPKKSGDVLHGIRLSDETLDVIDQNIREFFSIR